MTRCVRQTRISAHTYICALACFLTMLAAGCTSDNALPTGVNPATLAQSSGANAKASCAGVPVGTTSLNVVPSSQLTIGLRETVDIDVVNQANVLVPDCAVAWSSSKEKVASVNDAGQVIDWELERREGKKDG